MPELRRQTFPNWPIWRGSESLGPVDAGIGEMLARISAEFLLERNRRIEAWLRDLGFREDMDLRACGCEIQQPVERLRGKGIWKDYDVVLVPCRLHQWELGLRGMETLKLPGALVCPRIRFRSGGRSDAKP